MSDLTEAEILDCLKTNLKLAEANCIRLSRGERGPIFQSLRANLKLVEGACRQIAQWRGDARWLQVGLKVAEAQKRSGEWLRRRQPGWRFEGLGQIMAQYFRAAHNLETKATGRSGLILPKPLIAPHRETRPVSVLLPENSSAKTVVAETSAEPQLLRTANG